MIKLLLILMLAVYYQHAVHRMCSSCSDKKSAPLTESLAPAMNAKKASHAAVK